MITGDLRSKIDNVWNAFWAGGIANPIEVIEQITYLLFIRGLDEAHTREENKANPRTSQSVQRSALHRRDRYDLALDAE
jgi:type I restriction enzyme M protein